MVIAMDIKHIMLITNTIHTIKTLLYISKAFPLGFFNYLQPVLQGNLGIRESYYIIFERFFGYYSQGALENWYCKITKKIPILQIL